MYALLWLKPTNKNKNVPTPLSVPYTNIYHIAAPNIISYAKTSHFIVLFVDIVNIKF